MCVCVYKNICERVYIYVHACVFVFVFVNVLSLIINKRIYDIQLRVDYLSNVYTSAVMF